MRDSSGTILPVIGVLGLSLSESCDLIRNYQSLQEAEIISSEGYVHRQRFLVFELQRDGKKPIWVTLDRRRSTKVSVLDFLCAAASTPANDTELDTPITSMLRIYAFLNNNSTASATYSQKGRLHCVRAGNRQTLGEFRYSPTAIR